MNWEAIGALGQVLGSVAVFITLWYLAVQVSYARSETRRALGQSRADGIRDLYALGMDERVNRLLVKVQASRGEVPAPFQRVLIEQAGFTHEEALIVGHYERAWWNHTVQIIPNIDQLSPIERKQFDRISYVHYSQSPGALFFAAARPFAHADAIRYVDNLLALPQ